MKTSESTREAATVDAGVGGGRAAATKLASAGLAALLLMVGGLVVPPLGWVLGLVLVVLSRMWTWREKLLAILVPIVAGTGAVAFAKWATDGPASSVRPVGPSITDFVDPARLMAAVITIPIVFFVVGAWLLTVAIVRTRSGMVRPSESDVLTRSSN
jgi:hypothetical protein